MMPYDANDNEHHWSGCDSRLFNAKHISQTVMTMCQLVPYQNHSKYDLIKPHFFKMGTYVWLKTTFSLQ